MSWRLPFLVEALLTIFITGVPSRTASADPIPIPVSAGVIDIEMRSSEMVSRIDLRSGSDFRLNAASVFGSMSACSFCGPGDTTSLSAGIAPPIGGTLRYREQVFELGFGRFEDGGRGQLTLTAPAFVLPVSPFGTATFTSPFTLNGFVLAPDPDTLTLTGFGIVTGRFDVFPLDEAPGGQLYFANTLHFEFANAVPTPEPGTVILLGSALIGVLFRRGWQQTSSPDLRR